jgi:hypothetical protein
MRTIELDLIRIIDYYNYLCKLVGERIAIGKCCEAFGIDRIEFAKLIQKR